MEMLKRSSRATGVQQCNWILASTLDASNDDGDGQQPHLTLMNTYGYNSPNKEKDDRDSRRIVSYCYSDSAERGSTA